MQNVAACHSGIVVPGIVCDYPFKQAIPYTICMSKIFLLLLNARIWKVIVKLDLTNGVLSQCWDFHFWMAGTRDEKLNRTISFSLPSQTLSWRANYRALAAYFCNPAKMSTFL